MRTAVTKSKQIFQTIILLTLFFSFLESSPAMGQAVSTSGHDFLITVSPASLDVGTTALVTVALQTVPTQGYASAEFTCSYDSQAVQVGNFLAGAAFGDDPVMTIQGSGDGEFIVAIAGSRGSKATAGGVVFTFAARAIRPVQTSIHCTARVSTGDHVLTEIESAPAGLTIVGDVPTPTAPAPCDHARFIADVTVPDGTPFAPGQSFTKAWRFRNVGSCTWTTAYKFVFFSGELMGGPVSANLPSSVEPGQAVTISVRLTAPSTPGTYRGYWILQNANGALFGFGSQASRPTWVEIRVAGPSVTPGGPTLAPSATATPTFEPQSCDKAEFIADVSVPPGTVMSPGTVFRKTWRLKNVGTCTWTHSYRIALMSGPPMGTPSSVQFSMNVPPGAMVDITLEMTAPPVTGRHYSEWIFQNETGHPFGVGPLGNQPWSVDIMVVDSTVTPSPTPSFTPTSTPAPPTVSATISPGPGGPGPTPVPGVVYDFASNICMATWFSGAGQLPCPGIDGNAAGFAYRAWSFELETGEIDPHIALLTSPQNTQNGYIQGFYPPFRVQNGDRFRALLSCEFGATSCRGAFRLDYQVGSSPIRTFWGPFVEAYDGRTYTADIDLSRLAGQDVRFILTVLAAGNAAGDRLLWVGPVIYRPSAGSTPVASQTVAPGESATPTLTSSPSETSLITGQVFASRPVIIHVYDESQLLVTTQDVNMDGSFALPILPGSYSVLAIAPGFLNAQAHVTVTNENDTVLPAIHLLPGDIDNNNVIDALDALTIGMNYNMAFPTAADLNQDGILNVLDLELVAKNYRKTGPVAWQ